MGTGAFRFHLNKVDEDGLVIFFSSFKGKPSRDGRFDWWGHKDVYKNVLFIEDETNTWYHGCFGELRDFIRVVPQNTLMVGVSAGAYIALIMANEFDCFSMALNPQTCLFDYESIPHNNEWVKTYRKIREATRYPELMDISWVSGDKQHVYYSFGSSVDRFHAERMNTNLHPIDCELHGLGKWMQENGTLEDKLKDRMRDIGA